MNSLPMKVKIDPIPATSEYLMVFAQIVSKASLAAVQKFLPVSAI